MWSFKRLTRTAYIAGFSALTVHPARVLGALVMFSPDLTRLVVISTFTLRGCFMVNVDVVTVSKCYYCVTVKCFITEFCNETFLLPQISSIVMSTNILGMFDVDG